MFERRLKIFLAILLLVTGLMLVRAAQLQVLGGQHWQQQAADSMKRTRLIETTRGHILDAKNRPIAVDEACMDAAVDFRALTEPPNPEWLTVQAAARLRNELGDGYAKLAKEEREKRLKQAKDAVINDIAEMWKALAEEWDKKNQPDKRDPIAAMEEIEGIRRAIVERVQMRRRYVWYHKYRRAIDEQKGEASSAPWYSKWLLESDAGNGPDLDNFVEDVGEQEAAHPILHDITNDTYIRLKKSLAKYPGLTFIPSTDRLYPAPYNDVASHVLGRLSKVMQTDIQWDPNLGKDELREYQKNDLIGRTGLEALCEPALRGTRGRVVRAAGDATELARVESIPGADVRTTLDIELQRQVQGLFKQVQLYSRSSTAEPIQYFEMHGGAVVIDIPTGAVRAMVSWPNYDANTFDEQYAALSTDELNQPLYNRATRWPVEPGSTVKPIVGLGAITDGLFEVNQGLECTGYLVLRGREQHRNRCWVANMYIARLGKEGVKHHPIPTPHHGHDGNADGFLSFSDALERSCNVYFETVADKMGIAGLDRWFRRFGLGRPTGIGVDEARGLLPSAMGMSQVHVVRDTWNASIGQGQVSATVLQMANVAATVARDGVWVRPHLVEPGTPIRPMQLDGPDRIDLKLSPAAIAAAKKGMTDVVHSRGGTATFDDLLKLPVRVAGKTGSAQTPPLTTPVRGARGELTYECAICQADWKDPIVKKCEDKDCPSKKPRVRRQAYDPVSTQNPDGWPKWYRGFGPEGQTLSHAWFIGFAPAEKPQVAFAVMVEYGGSGGFAAGSVAAPLINACIQHGYLTATPTVAGAAR